MKLKKAIAALTAAVLMPGCLLVQNLPCAAAEETEPDPFSMLPGEGFDFGDLDLGDLGDLDLGGLGDWLPGDLDFGDTDPSALIDLLTDPDEQNEAGAWLLIDSCTVFPGGTLHIPIRLHADQPLAEFSCQFNIPEQVQFEYLETGTVDCGLTFEQDEQIMRFSSTEPVQPNITDVLAYLVCELPENTSDCQITCADVTAYNADGEAVGVAVCPGSVLIVTDNIDDLIEIPYDIPELGLDLNGDGSLSVADAVGAMRFLTEDDLFGGFELTEEAAALLDADSDGALTILDIRILLRSIGIML